MKTRTLLIYLLLSLVVLSACAPVASAEPVAPTEAPPESSVAPTEAPAVTEEPTSPASYPLSTRTGIADVDAVLAAVESGDVQALRELIRFTAVGCTNAEALGSPPKCPEGEAEGTLVNVLPLLGPEGSFLLEADLSSFAPMPAVGIYAVYSVSDSAYSEDAFPAGEYAAVFTTAEDQIFIVFQIRAGIVRMDTVFSSSSLDAVVQRDALDVILAPK